MKRKINFEVQAKFFALLIFTLLLVAGCGGGGNGGDSGGTIGLAWDSNTEADLAGYRVYYRPASSAYDNVVNAGLPTQSNSTVSYTLSGLTPGQIYFIAVTAYDTSGNESGFSNEVSGPAK